MSSIALLGADDIEEILAGAELDLISCVEEAYRTLGEGDYSLPPSVFLRFPNEPRNRIIALPARLGGHFDTAGMKWISSFPGNHDKQMDRASAVIVLNDPATGRPTAVLEGSIISAKRTAASAALAAGLLAGDGPPTRLSVIGCGLINFEIVRFLQQRIPSLERVTIHDLEPSRARVFRDRLSRDFGIKELRVESELRSALDEAELVSFATTAGEPYVTNLAGLAPGAVVLHISLRDLDPHLIASCMNIVDDADHVCRAGTSLHLAEEMFGTRDFITANLPELLQRRSWSRSGDRAPIIFSPFGLGILDLAVAKQVFNDARRRGLGMEIPDFLPRYWSERKEPGRTTSREWSCAG